jgi:hypothetical protein
MGFGTASRIKSLGKKHDSNPLPCPLWNVDIQKNFGLEGSGSRFLVVRCGPSHLGCLEFDGTANRGLRADAARKHPGPSSRNAEVRASGFPGSNWLRLSMPNTSLTIYEAKFREKRTNFF